MIIHAYCPTTRQSLTFGPLQNFYGSYMVLKGSFHYTHFICSFQIHGVFYHEALALTVVQLNGRPNKSFKEIMSYLSPSVIAFSSVGIPQCLGPFWTITQAGTWTEASMARNQKSTKHFLLIHFILKLIKLYIQYTNRPSKHSHVPLLRV